MWHATPHSAVTETPKLRLHPHVCTMGVPERSPGQASCSSISRKDTVFLICSAVQLSSVASRSSTLCRTVALCLEFVLGPIDNQHLLQCCLGLQEQDMLSAFMRRILGRKDTAIVICFAVQLSSMAFRSRHLVPHCTRRLKLLLGPINAQHPLQRCTDLQDHRGLSVSPFECCQVS